VGWTMKPQLCATVSKKKELNLKQLKGEPVLAE
jgi:hypothetical protein